jgi:hypothetical protein
MADRQPDRQQERDPSGYGEGDGKTRQPPPRGALAGGVPAAGARGPTPGMRRLPPPEEQRLDAVPPPQRQRRDQPQGARPAAAVTVTIARAASPSRTEGVCSQNEAEERYRLRADQPDRPRRKPRPRR